MATKGRRRGPQRCCCCCCCGFFFLFLFGSCCCGFSAPFSVAVGIMTFPAAAAAVLLAACSDASQRWMATVVGYAATVGMRACKQPPGRGRGTAKPTIAANFKRVCKLTMCFACYTNRGSLPAGRTAARRICESDGRRESATQITPLCSRAASSSIGSMQTREERQSANVWVHVCALLICICVCMCDS